MAQSLSAVYLHVVFSTKDRHPYLADNGLRNEMHAFLGGICRELDCPPIMIGGVEDHVHILARHGRTLSQAEWIKELKRASSLWIKERNHSMRHFAWQAGYGVFSVSVSNLETVSNYVNQQEEHHRKTTFQDEFRALMKRHRIEWDERYVWD